MTMPEAAKTTAELLAFGPVHLDIRALDRSVDFWRDLVGLQRIDVAGTAEAVASLGVDSSPLVVLHPSAARPVQRGFRGLYHFAINLPSEAELARVIARIRASGHRFGAIDHVVAKSIYVNDPDGIGVEITFETPDRVRSFQWDEGSKSALIIDAEGRKRSGVEPLNVEEVLESLADHDFMRPLPTGTVVGHFHFRVASIEASYAFYRDAVGLIPSMYAPWAGYGDLGAGGQVTHRIALNTWQGAGVPPRPPGVAGLRSLSIRFGSVEQLRGAIARIGRVETRNGEHVARDPDGNVLVLSAVTIAAAHSPRKEDPGRQEKRP